MFKYFLSLTFAVCLASAAIINTTATCDGRTITGTLSASCNDGINEAHARLEISGSFSVLAEASTTDFGGCCDQATANFSDDYVFTVNGGTGNGFFYPCFVGGGENSVTMSLAGIPFNASGQGLNSTNCSQLLVNIFHQSKPLIFGVPQIVQVDMMASASQEQRFFHGMVSESLDHFLFFDPAGNQLSNVTFTLVEVPEPRTWCLLGVGLMCLLAVPICGVRRRGRFQVVIIA